MRPRWILTICAAISLGVVGYALLSPTGAPRVRAQQDKLDALDKDVQALRAGNDELREQARRLRGETPETRPYLEQAAREELGYVRPDERVVLLDATAESGPSAETGP